MNSGQERVERRLVGRAIRLSPLDPLGGYFTGGLALANLIARRYEEASEWAAQSLYELPRYTHAIRTKVVCCAHLGLIAESHNWVRRLLELQPSSTIGKWKANAVRFFPPERL